MSNSKKINNLGIFCGASIGNNPIYRNVTEKFADALSHANIGIIYGGSKVGLMGVIADRMLKNGSSVIGVMPQSLVDVELAHDQLTKLYIVDSMSARKTKIAELSDGFVMLPGGAGSLDEFFEMFTFAQLGYHSKPCAILNVEHYYDFLLQFLDHATHEGFLKNIFREMIIVDESPEKLIERCENYQAVKNTRWK